jgi:hypothetical protein
LHHASEASGFRSPIEARLAGDQSMMQSSQDPRNAKKNNTRTGKRAPERAKKRKGEQKTRKNQKNAKNAKKQKHKTIKIFAGPKKTFLSVPLLV